RQVLAHARQDAALTEDYRRSLQPVVDDHRAVQAAVAAGDVARAGALMQAHLLATPRDMTELLDPAGGRAGAPTTSPRMAGSGSTPAAPSPTSYSSITPPDAIGSARCHPIR